MFTSPHECGLCTYHVSSSIASGLYLAAEAKGPQFLQKNPPAEISGYGSAPEGIKPDPMKVNAIAEITSPAVTRQV